MKITTKYRPSAFFLLATLLFAIIGKEAHYLVCHHNHVPQAICHADGGETYFCNAQCASTLCVLCLFHIPPSEMPVATWEPGAILPIKNQFLPYTCFQLYNATERLLPVRAPPATTA